MARLAQELQHEEEQIELSIRADEQAGAQLAAQLYNQEEADERCDADRRACCCCCCLSQRAVLARTGHGTIP